jgi:transposase-like protein
MVDADTVKSFVVNWYLGVSDDYASRYICRIPTVWMRCKCCGSENLTKKGFIDNKQVYKCKDCGYKFYGNQNFKDAGRQKTINYIKPVLRWRPSLRKAQQNLEQIFGVEVATSNLPVSKLCHEYIDPLRLCSYGYLSVK